MQSCRALEAEGQCRISPAHLKEASCWHSRERVNSSFHFRESLLSTFFGGETSDPNSEEQSQGAAAAMEMSQLIPMVTFGEGVLVYHLAQFRRWI